MAITNIEDFKNELDIVDVISRVVPLKPSGTDSFKGCCPFHSEKTPSFHVTRKKNMFYCFGCEASGDVISFTQRYYNLDFVDAVNKLAQENGIDYQFKSSKENDKRERYYEINKEAARFFYNAFTENKNPGYTYMHNRDLTDETLKKFGIGYADSSWDSLYKHLKSKGYKEDELVDLGLLSHKDNKYYDKFRDRVMFPIINSSGKVVGFTGRAIVGQDPKYLNTTENIAFLKKNNLYGINLSKQDIGKLGYAVLVEGNVDVISLYQAGIQNVTASCGTALNENQAKLLKKYAKKVVLSYDSDKAGINASLRGIDILEKEGLKVYVMHVTSGKDPDDFIKSNGKDAYLELIDKALPATEYKLNDIKKGLDLNNAEDKVEYISRAVKILKELPLTTMDIYIDKLSNELNISKEYFKREIEGIKTLTNTYQVEVKKDEKDEPIDNLTTIEQTLIKVLFIQSNLIEEIVKNEGIFETPLGIKIKNLMYEQYGIKGSFEDQDIYDMLDPDSVLYLKSVINGIIISGKEEQVLKECIRKWKYNKLKLREKELINIISMADEKENINEIEKFSIELKNIQQELLKIKR